MRWDFSNFALLDLTKQWQMGKLIKMHLLPKIIRLGYSTRSTIKEHTHMFNCFFYFWLFDKFQPRYKLFFQGVQKLLAKIVIVAGVNKVERSLILFPSLVFDFLTHAQNHFPYLDPLTLKYFSIFILYSYSSLLSF